MFITMFIQILFFHTSMLLAFTFFKCWQNPFMQYLYVFIFFIRTLKHWNLTLRFYFIDKIFSMPYLCIFIIFERTFFYKKQLNLTTRFPLVDRILCNVWILYLLFSQEHFSYKKIRLRFFINQLYWFLLKQRNFVSYKKNHEKSFERSSNTFLICWKKFFFFVNWQKILSYGVTMFWLVRNFLMLFKKFVRC